MILMSLELKSTIKNKKWNTIIIWRWRGEGLKRERYSYKWKERERENNKRENIYYKRNSNLKSKLIYLSTSIITIKSHYKYNQLFFC